MFHVSARTFWLEGMISFGCWNFSSESGFVLLSKFRVSCSLGILANALIVATVGLSAPDCSRELDRGGTCDMHIRTTDERSYCLQSRQE